MRGGTCTTVTGVEYCGIMVSRRAKLFGFRLHLTTTLDQKADQWMLAPAARWDGRVSPALLEEVWNLIVLGDNALHDPVSIDWLKRQRHIILMAAQRRDGKEPWPAEVRRWFNRIRRRIESVLSVLCTVFNLGHPGSRSLFGLLVRTATRLLAYELSFLTCAILCPAQN